MATDLADIRIVVRETGSVQAARNLREVADAGDRAERATANIAGGAEKASRGLGALATPLRQLSVLFAATFGARVVGDVIAMADSFQSLQSRLALVVGGSEEAAAVMDRLYAVSQKNRQSFEDTGGLFARIGQQMKDLGRSTDETVTFIDALQKSIVIGGSSAAEASAGLQQLAQAIGSGVLRGDEFNSMMENMPGVARTLAEALGVPLGALRDLARDGKLTAEIITEAFILMNDKLQADFDKMPVTVGQALQQVRNEIFLLAGTINETTGATGGLANAVQAYAGYLHALGEILRAVIPVAREWLDLIGAAIAKLGELSGVTNAVGSVLSATKDGLSGLGEAAKPVVGWFGEIKAKVAEWAGAARSFPGMAEQAAATAASYEALADAFGIAAAGARELNEISGGAGQADLGGGAGDDQLANREERLAALRQRVQEMAEADAKHTAVMREQADAVTEIIRGLQEKVAAGQLDAREAAIRLELDRAAQAAMRDGNLLAGEQLALIRQLAGAVYDQAAAKRAGEEAERKAAQAAREAAEEAKRQREEQERAIEGARDAYGALAGSLDPAIRKQQELARTQGILNDAVRLGITTQAEADRLLQLYSDREAAAAAVLEKHEDKIGDYIRKLRERVEIEAMSDDARAERLALDEAINIAMAEGNLLTAEQVEEIKALVAAEQGLVQTKRDAERAAREAERAAERQAEVALEPFKQMARAIQGVFADMFAEIFKTGKVSFEQLAEAGTKIFSQFAGTVTSELLMRPLMASIDAMDKSGSFLGIGGGTWGALGMIGGNMMMNKLLGPRQGSFADMGSMIGGLAGAALGPLGMIGGSLLGNFAGGLFGKKSSGPVGRANLVVQNGQFALGSAAGDNGADISQLTQQVQAVAGTMNQFMARFGLTAAGGGFIGAMGFGENSGGVGTPEELLAQALRAGALRGTGSVGIALQNTKQTTLEGIASDLDFAKVYDELVKMQPELTGAEGALKKLREQFGGAKERAAALGLSVSALDAAMKRMTDKMRDDFNKEIQDAILGLTDPDQLALQKLKEQYEQRKKDAIALGADLIAVEKLYGLERQKLIEEQNKALYDTIKKGLKQLIDEMTMGDLSVLSASDRLAAVGAKYSDVESRALAGDRAAQEEFDAIARQYLDVARENFASGEGFQSVFDRVLASAQTILGTLPGAGTAANDNVVGAVVTGTDNIVTAVHSMTAEIVRLREENASMRSTLDRYVSGQAAAGGRG